MAAFAEAARADGEGWTAVTRRQWLMSVAAIIPATRSAGTVVVGHSNLNTGLTVTAESFVEDPWGSVPRAQVKAFLDELERCGSVAAKYRRIHQTHV